MSAFGPGFAFIEGGLGAVGGFGQGMADQALLEQKDQMEALREARLSQLRTTEHAANTKADIEAKQGNEDAQAAKRAQFYQNTTLPNQTISDTASGTFTADDGTPGSTSSNTVDTTTPPSRTAQAQYRLEEAKKTGRTDLINQSYLEDKDVRADQDQARKIQLEQSKLAIEAGHNDYYAALAQRARADADAIESGNKYNKSQKAQLPNIKVERDASGMSYSVDANSGAVGVLVPGEDAIPEKTHWFKPNEPGKASTPAHMVWTVDGNPLPGGLADLYPDISQRRDNAKRAKGIIDNASSDPGDALTRDIAASSGDEGAPAATHPAAPPVPGTVMKGYRFKGGNPRDKNAWEKVK